MRRHPERCGTGAGLASAGRSLLNRWAATCARNPSRPREASVGPCLMIGRTTTKCNVLFYRLFAGRGPAPPRGFHAHPDRPGGLPHSGQQGYAKLLKLAAGDVGPTAGVIDLQIGFPMVHGPQHVTAALAQQREIEVRVAIARIDAEGGLVAELGFGQVAALVVEVAQIEIRQRVVGIGLQCASVVVLGFFELAQAVTDSAQVDQRAGGLRVELDGPQIGLHSLFDGRAGFFQKQAFLKPDFGIALTRRRGRPGWQGLHTGRGGGGGRGGRDCTLANSDISKSKRICPVRASIFWPATRTAILRPSEKILSSVSGSRTSESRCFNDWRARPILRRGMRRARNSAIVRRAIRSRKE